jgi:hypothetical protein
MGWLGLATVSPSVAGAATPAISEVTVSNSDIVTNLLAELEAPLFNLLCELTPVNGGMGCL